MGQITKLVRNIISDTLREQIQSLLPDDELRVLITDATNEISWIKKRVADERFHQPRVFCLGSSDLLLDELAHAMDPLKNLVFLTAISPRKIVDRDIRAINLRVQNGWIISIFARRMRDKIRREVIVLSNA